MIMKNSSLFIIFLCCFYPSFSQTVSKKHTGFKTYIILENISYEIFPKEKPKEFKLTRNLEEADNSTLAGLLNSLFWENTLEWYAYNRGMDVKEARYDSSYFESKKNATMEYGWWGPNMAIYYTKEGEQYCFLKNYWHANEVNKTYSVSGNLMFKNGKWVQGGVKYQRSW
jgi:hypothetical protein